MFCHSPRTTCLSTATLLSLPYTNEGPSHLHNPETAGSSNLELRWQCDGEPGAENTWIRAVDWARSDRKYMEVLRQQDELSDYFLWQILVLRVPEVIRGRIYLAHVIIQRGTS